MREFRNVCLNLYRDIVKIIMLSILSLFDADYMDFSHHGCALTFLSGSKSSSNLT
jgi:hypothetical protein